MLQGVALIDDTGMKDEEKDTGRIDEFRDGVWAIAPALLALETGAPYTTSVLSDYLTKAGAVVACAVYRGRFCPHQRRLQPPVVRGGEGPRPASERRSGRGHPQVHEKLPTRLSALSAGDRRCFCQPLCHHRHLHGIVGVLGLYEETGRG